MIEPNLNESFSEYAVDGAAGRAARDRGRQGVSSLAEEIGMTRQGLQKALSAKGNPRLDNINAIMRAMGYQLLPHRIEERAV